ncbi:uncharacterized protein Dwil_GK14533 [Drosophila willistoni]|uniref:RNA helicase n=1 Tax=Drosophila willistoni TaxID=7260 RepID=B4MX38_DROWI|nr:uncharacterized protein Dwil_GK14533 [Drosophila willistoni]
MTDKYEKALVLIDRARIFHSLSNPALAAAQPKPLVVDDPTLPAQQQVVMVLPPEPEPARRGLSNHNRSCGVYKNLESRIRQKRVELVGSQEVANTMDWPAYARRCYATYKITPTPPVRQRAAPVPDTPEALFEDMLMYTEDQHVIVEFLSWNSPKFIRGVICQSKDEEYLVSALDYGFTIKCSAQNLWLLPKEYQMKCLNIKKGCVASVIPLNDTNWSKEALHDFDKKVEESSHLSFLPEYNNLGSTNIQNAMKRFNLHNTMQLLAWPHLMQNTGNSLLLINKPNSGRTWCYLPALCSLVMRKMQHKIHNKNELTLFDSNYLELFVCDDYDRLRLSNAKLLNEVLQQSRSILKFPLLRFVLISQQWHRKVFTKLIKDLAGEALILFGDYLEAAMYGGLTMETVLRRTNDKLTQLVKYIDQHKSKRILIYCKSQQELQYLTKELTEMGQQCIGISEAENQQTHQLLLLTDESSHPEHLIKKNIEVLIHYSMPDSWTKFVFRFHSLMDNIANLLVPTQNTIKVVTHLMLDQSNYHDLSRLMMFFDSHGIAVDKIIQQVVVSYQKEIEMKRPFCPNLLHSGKCNQKQQCDKRHHFLQSDLQGPKGPMEQSGALVRCFVLKVYDPVHMAVRPIEFKPPGSSKWLPAPSSDSQLLMAFALSMAMKSKPHLPLKTGDVCAIHQQGQFKRVRIVDIPQGCPVTVQLMDLGTELLQVKPIELLECDEKFQNAPSLAMDVRLTQLQPTGGETANWTLEAIKWVTNTFKGLNEQEYIQIYVDFAILNVIYASEIAIIEKCQTMRTFVYKLKLRKELLLKGYAQFQENIDHIQIEKYKQQEQNSKPNKLTKPKANEHLEEPLKNVNETTSEININCNSRKSNRISLMLAAINKFILRTESSVQLESEIIQEKHVEPLKVELPVMDSTTQFFNTLIGQLNVENSSIKSNSAQKLINNIFGSTLEKAKVKEELENTLPIPSSEISVTDSAQISTDHTTSALKCIKIAEGAVCPKVKWRQTLGHIDITFEQQVPQYELILQANTLSYSVIKAEPPQRCVLNLLGEVKIVSEQQHGYILHVKLAKLSLVCYWPTLLNSLYAQQHSHWLIYDTERAKSPPQRMGVVLWQRYVRRLDETNDTTDDEDHQGVHQSSDEQIEQGVERCESLFADHYKDF